MKLNRKLVLVLALVLSLAMATGGTLAYLTDRDSEVNTFTMGDVRIDLTEEFEQESELLPGVRIEKEAKITNTGKNDAWVWMTVAVPAVLDDENTELGKANVLHWNMPGCFWNGYHDDDKYIQSGIADGYLPEGSTGVADEDSWINDNVAAKETIDGVEYNVYTFKYVGPIVPGETTNIGLSKVFLDENVDIDTDGQLYVVENGVATKVDWNINSDGAPKVIVSAYAMQKEGFDNVEAAYNAYKTQWGDNGTEYDGSDKGEETAPAAGDDNTVTYEIPADAKTVSNTEELLSALAAGDTTILLKDGTYQWSSSKAGNNKTLNLYGESKNVVLENTFEGEDGADYDFTGSSVNFYGLTIDSSKNTGSVPGYARMSATYNDCVIVQMYTLYGDSEFNYCTLNATGDTYNIKTWGAPTATFNNCTFNSDGKAMLLYGTVDTKLTLNDCVFNDNGGLTDLKAAVEIGNDYDKSYELIVNNTTVNGYEINDKGINTGTTLWGNKNSMGTDKLNVVVDGVDVY